MPAVAYGLIAAIDELSLPRGDSCGRRTAARPVTPAPAPPILPGLMRGVRPRSRAELCR
jgi:hypothetical protein